MRWLVMIALAAAMLAASAPRPATADLAQQCDTATIQAMAPSDTTVGFASREQGGCRVSGYVTTTNPGPNRVIFMLMLPDNFNGRYLYLGVGGAGGTLPTANPALIRAGYAIAGSDGGTGPRNGADFNLGSNAGRELDFSGGRGVHVTAIATEQITRAFYQRQNLHRYISGCSGGGAMGFTNAFLHGNDDFDGFLVGAIQFPGAVYMPQLYRIGQHVQSHPDGWISPDLLRRAQAAIIQRYDDTDGAVDGVIADPRNITNFDEGILRQVGFTPAQIETFRLMNNPPRFPRTAYNPAAPAPGYPVTSMGGWSRFLLGNSAPPWGDTSSSSATDLLAHGAPYMHVMVDSRTRSMFPDRSYVGVTKPDELMRIATREGHDNMFPSVDVFDRPRAAGVRIIVYQGVADQALPFTEMVRGDDAVRAHYSDAQSWIRAYGVPGMLHCAGGTGPTDVDLPLLEALVGWVEHGAAPESIVAPRQTPQRGVEREFLLCPEPRRAHLKSSGLDATRADNWECRAPTH